MSHAAGVILYVLRSVSLPVAALAIINSILLIIAHARENRHPLLRVYTVRILLMVVIDSVAAVCALWGTGWMPRIDGYVDNILHFIVELYESLVIFSFLQFVLVCGCGPERLAARFQRRGGPEGPTVVVIPPAASTDVAAAAGSREDPELGNEGAQPSMSHGDAGVLAALGGEAAAAAGGAAAAGAPAAAARSLPGVQQVCEAAGGAKPLRELKHLPLFSRILPPWRSGKQMLRWCVLGTLGYVVVGAALAILGILLLVTPGAGREKSIVWQVSSAVLSAAQAIAILALAELAVNVKEDLALLRPYGKFLSVKFVVFFAFWQGMLLRLLMGWGAFDFFANRENARVVVQNTLICIEMLAASVVHFYVFPPHDYLRLLAQNHLRNHEHSPVSLNSPATVAEVLDIRDIFHTAIRVQRNRTLEMEPKCHTLPARFWAGRLTPVPSIGSAGNRDEEEDETRSVASSGRPARGTLTPCSC